MKFSTFCKFLAFFIIYGMLLVSFLILMFRIFSIILLSLTPLVMQSYAACNNDLTKSDFTICTGLLNPLPGAGEGSDAK